MVLFNVTAMFATLLCIVEVFVDLKKGGVLAARSTGKSTKEEWEEQNKQKQRHDDDEQDEYFAGISNNYTAASISINYKEDDRKESETARLLTVSSYKDTYIDE